MENRKIRRGTRINNKMMIINIEKLQYIEQLITINIGLTDALLDKLESAKALMEQIEEFDSIYRYEESIDNSESYQLENNIIDKTKNTISSKDETWPSYDPNDPDDIPY